jgi:ribosomal protein L29
MRVARSDNIWDNTHVSFPNINMAEGNSLPDAEQWRQMSPEEKQQQATELLLSAGPLIEECRDKSADEVRKLLEDTADPEKRKILQVVFDMKEAGL